jgi:hypothetical protein
VKRTVRFVGDFYASLITQYLFADGSVLRSCISINCFFLTDLSGDAWSTMHSSVCVCALICAVCVMWTVRLFCCLSKL